MYYSSSKFLFAEVLPCSGQILVLHILPCHVCDGHVCVLYVLSSSSFSSSFCGLYVHRFPFPFLPNLQPWDLHLHDEDLCGDLCCDLYDDPLLVSVGMDLGKHLQEELLDIHLVPLDKPGVLELHKALLPEVHWVPQEGVGLDGETYLVLGLMGMQGYIQGGREGFVGLLEEGGL